MSFAMGDSVNRWVLGIELNGEWEECAFLSQTEALSTFQALATDYESRLNRAILFAPLLREPAATGPRMLQ